MSEAPIARPGSRALLVAASAVIVIAGFKTAANLVLPFLLAVFLAMISLPLLFTLQRRGLPKFVSVVVTVVVELGILAGIGSIVGNSINEFAQEAPRYQARLRSLATATTAWFRERGVDLPDRFATELVNPGMAFDVAADALRGVASILSQAVLVFLLVIFILFEAAGFPEKLQVAFGKADAPERYAKMQHEIQHYLGIKTVVSLVTGSVAGLGCWAVGVDFPVLWGLLAFLLNYIPNLGSILAGIPPFLLALVQFGVARALAIVAIYVAINVVMGNFVEPYFMGRGLGLSTLVVFLSLVFWGWVWGPVGMLLSVPLTMIVKIMLENTDDLRWIAVLLDGSPARLARPSGDDA